MKRIFLDSSCWFEYLTGSSVGLKVHELLSDESNTFFFTTTHLAEIISKVRRSGKDAGVCYTAICAHVEFVPITTQLSYEAGLKHAQIRKTIADFGLADAIALCICADVDAHIFTTDSHFKDFKSATVLY